MNTIQRHNLRRLQPAIKWVEGIPTGNGTLGVMAWGGPDELRLALDRSDLWWRDCPPPKERRITAGTLILEGGNGDRFEEGLDLATAVAYRTTGPRQVEWFVHAEEPLLCLRINPAPRKLRLRWQPPALWNREAEDLERYRRQDAGLPTRQSLNLNPYAAVPTTSHRDVKDGVGLMGFAIAGRERLRVCVRACLGGRTVPLRRKGAAFEVDAPAGDELLLLVNVWNLWRMTAGETDAAISQLLARTAPHWRNLRASHCAWWREFWSRSSVALSNPVLERLWYRGTYQLGCCARPETLPMALQGVWGSDGMPPWHGAYTWDLNVQTCYWPIYTGNHLELGHSLYDWYRAKLPVLAEYARTLFGAEGAVLPLTTDAEGRTKQPEKAPAYAADGAWVCHNFWQHYLYTGHRAFLRSHCLPVFREHLKFARFLWRKGRDGHYHLAHASTPEISFLATPQCPCRDTAYEIAFARFLARAYLQTLQSLGERRDELAAWAEDFLRRVVDYPTAQTTGLNSYWPEDPSVPDFFVEWPGLETQMSHRHFSHLMMLYPLDEIHRFSPYAKRRCAQNSIHMLILRGTGGWAGFSFPWASLLATHAAWPSRMPVHMLEEFAKCVVVPCNGLALNEDYLRLGVINQTGAFGPFHLDNFTLEASLMAVTAVQDLLLHSAGRQLVFGGGAPPELDAEFRGFRTPFGDAVSGRIEGGHLVAAELHSDRRGTRHVALGDASAHWQLKTAAGITRRNASRISVPLAKGEVGVLRLA